MSLSDMILPGNCPKCFGDKSDCDQCGGTGLVAFRVDAGEMWTCRCRDCGHCNGIRINSEDCPLNPDSDPVEPPYCIECRQTNVEWSLVGRKCS